MELEKCWQYSRMIALKQNIHNVTRSIFEYLKFDDQSKYCFKTISNKMEFYQCPEFLYIQISRKFLNCASYLVFILIIKLTIMILSGIACDAITNKYCFCCFKRKRTFYLQICKQYCEWDCISEIAKLCFCVVRDPS